MNYSTLKSLLSPLTPRGDWPSSPDANSTITVISPGDVDPQLLSLSQLETALSDYLDNAPITAVVNALPSQLSSIAQKILSQLSINELSVSVGAESSGELPVSDFSFTLAIHFSSPPTLMEVQLDALALELNMMFIADSLCWDGEIIANCEFLSAQCDLAVQLRSPAFELLLSQSNTVGIDSILGSAQSGMSMSTLQDNLGVSGSTEGTTINLFKVSADFSDTQQFSCMLAVTASDWQWRNCDLTNLGIAFQYGGGNTLFMLTATADIGDILLDVSFSHSSGTTALDSNMSCQGNSLNDVVNSLAGVLGYTNPVTELSDVELNNIDLSLKDSDGSFTMDLSCDGAIAFDASGSSLAFTFSFDWQSGKDVDVKLGLDSLTFDFEEKDSSYYFTYSGKETLSLESLVKMAQLYPLYGVANDISLTLNSGVFVMTPGTNSKNYLAALDFSLDATINNDLLEMIIGGSVGLDGATIIAANTDWTLDQLGAIDNSPISFSKPVNSGVSFIGSLTMGSVSTSATLSPPAQNNSSDQAASSTPPTPQPVSSSNSAKWFNVQSQLGPVHLDRLGFAFDSSGSDGIAIEVLADAEFDFGPMTVGLTGFSITVPYAKPADVTVGLSGMSVAYNNTPLSISGGLLNEGSDTFAGEIAIESETLFISGLGEYAKKDDYTSLSLFAAMSEPLGGPPFCFVDGLAAGGGYNSALNIPAKVSQVASFPLITAAQANAPINDPMSIIAACITPQEGEDWLALGLLFRSFEVVQSTALLTAAFGDNLQFAILGQAEMSIPPASDTRIAYAQVDVEAQYIPSEEALSVTGYLTPNSYVLSKDCHIQGGFAFILKGDGDFVMSYGGYAPFFDWQAKGYPAVPRLSLDWHIDSHTNIKGSEYFALTPSAMMAGGSLEATWDSGIFSAWFDVSLDILIQWRPFYYEADFHMSLGVSFDLKIWFVHVHFSFHIGADIGIQGPPFHGHAHIDLDVVSFTIDFGDQAGKPDNLTWPEFRQMLPGNAANDATNSDLLAIKVSNGLTQDLTNSTNSVSGAATTDTLSATNSDPSWVVNGSTCSFTIQSSLPITETASGKVSVTASPTSADIGVLPMGESSASGLLQVVIKDKDGNLVAAQTPDNATNTTQLLVINQDTSMAPAHWGTSAPSQTSASTIACTSGYVISAAQPTPDQTSPVALSTLLAENVTVVAQSDRTASASPFGS